MCDELGDDEYMQGFVMRAGSTSLCSIQDGEGCGEKELSYIKKWKMKSSGEITKQLSRLEGMKESKMKPDLLKWINQRLAILQQYSESGDSEKSEL
mmetsp:Transcript_16750/g.20662  ORF Transcript_16750/g.20662 Transcript_16750/m.20662 type:complete len:96 (+) Transcript_16750:543-830(+)